MGKQKFLPAKRERRLENIRNKLFKKNIASKNITPVAIVKGMALLINFLSPDLKDLSSSKIREIELLKGKIDAKLNKIEQNNAMWSRLPVIKNKSLIIPLLLFFSLAALLWRSFSLEDPNLLPSQLLDKPFPEFNLEDMTMV